MYNIFLPARNTIIRIVTSLAIGLFIFLTPRQAWAGVEQEANSPASIPEKIIKIIVTARRNQTTSQKEPMTFYGVSSRDLNELLPSPQALNANSVLSELPGVQTYAGLGGFALSMPGGPHVRGGTGMGTVYALDGIPLNNNTLFNDMGNVGLATGVSEYQFYPGVYPVQYGNGMDGYQNSVVPEGFGKFHGTATFSLGFWLDPGENSPLFSANPASGSIGGVVGKSSIRPANPGVFDLQFSGQTGKFHYFFNTLLEDGGGSAVSDPFLAAALTYSGIGGTVYQKKTKDAILKFSYEASADDKWEALFAAGSSYSSPLFELTIQNGLQATFLPVPAFTFQSYTLESFAYTHRFPAKQSISVRLWKYDSNPDQYLPSVADGYFVQNDISRQTAAKIEYENQIRPNVKLKTGVQYIYTDDFQEMAPESPNPSALILGNADFGGANNQQSSAWVNGEWNPNPRLYLTAGIRWDKMVYQTPRYGGGFLTQSNGRPFAVEAFTGFSPDSKINDSSDTTGLFTGCTPQFNICSDSGLFSPSFLEPRISLGYTLTDHIHLKGAYGRFNTFAQDAAVSGLSNLCAPQTGIAGEGNNCQVTGNVNYTTAGNKAETGTVEEASFEYLWGAENFLKITPFLKSVKNPIIYTYVPLAQAGGEVNGVSLGANGIELQLHAGSGRELSGTVNYTYVNSTTIGNPEYSFLLLPQFQASNPINGAAVAAPNALANSSEIFNQMNSQSVPADWNIHHTVNLLLLYKPSPRFEIAPNFTFASGQPYGLGDAALKSLYANLQSLCSSPPATNPYLTPAGCSEDLPAGGNYNPLHETTPNSLAGPSSLLANLAVTYHATKELSATMSVYNLFNNGEILSFNSTPYFPAYMAAFGYPNTKDFSPIRGSYAPLAVQPIRQYDLTIRWKF